MIRSPSVLGCSELRQNQATEEPHRTAGRMRHTHRPEHRHTRFSIYQISADRLSPQSKGEHDKHHAGSTSPE
uniref:Uncharacterized protein n=1 Tax=Nothobranchius rachovii TaxID=451742 RepID=A0A1A8RQE9_9TELE